MAYINVHENLAEISNYYIIYNFNIIGEPLCGWEVNMVWFDPEYTMSPMQRLGG